MTGGSNREAPRAPADDAPAPTPGTRAGTGRGQEDPDRGFLIAGAVVKPLMRVWFRMSTGRGERTCPRWGR